MAREIARRYVLEREAEMWRKEGVRARLNIRESAALAVTCAWGTEAP
jgi:hypothetical protein